MIRSVLVAAPAGCEDLVLSLSTKTRKIAANAPCFARAPECTVGYSQYHAFQKKN